MAMYGNWLSGEIRYLYGDGLSDLEIATFIYHAVTVLQNRMETVDPNFGMIAKDWEASGAQAYNLAASPISITGGVRTVLRVENRDGSYHYWRVPDQTIHYETWTDFSGFAHRRIIESTGAFGDSIIFNAGDIPANETNMRIYYTPSQASIAASTLDSVAINIPDGYYPILVALATLFALAKNGDETAKSQKVMNLLNTYSIPHTRTVMTWTDTVDALRTPLVQGAQPTKAA